MLLLTFITPVEIGLSIGFFSTLVGSLLFCLWNYSIDEQEFKQPSEDGKQLKH